jgi:hypothetical protein
MITRSRKLSLKLVYQLTHKMMICRSKCRPFNRSSIGLNDCIPHHRPVKARLHQNPQILQRSKPLWYRWALEDFTEETSGSSYGVDGDGDDFDGSGSPAREIGSSTTVARADAVVTCARYPPTAIRFEHFVQSGPIRPWGSSWTFTSGNIPCPPIHL